jgi:hypothetical protein
VEEEGSLFVRKSAVIGVGNVKAKSRVHFLRLGTRNHYGNCATSDLDPFVPDADGWCIIVVFEDDMMFLVVMVACGAFATDRFLETCHFGQSTVAFGLQPRSRKLALRMASSK